ncbi:MAG TPA: fused MFS/spermidine synthase [Planctomycetota bacterium]
MPLDRGAAPARAGAPFVLPLYTLTLFLSAFLLFAVQPMFTKAVLPLLGGSAAVWNTAVVFFQATLLLGYGYAHVSTRCLGPRAQTLTHAGVLALGALALPIGVAAGWSPPAGGTQIPWLIGLLAASIGLPFFAVSATAPLLQRWFAHTDHAAAGDPYFLYGASNLGSLAALFSYPFLVEPLLGLAAQGWAWTAGYALLALAIAGCGVTLVRRHRAVGAPQAEEGGLVRELSWSLRARWLALATVPSALLLGVTLHVGSEIVAVPLLWVVPLALYLLTFVLAFARRSWIAPVWVRRAQVVVVVLVAGMFQSGAPGPLFLVGLHVAGLFLSAWVCHAELARRRPVAAHLTEFYLWMSVGGVLGGVLASIVAPLVFDSVLEYPLALVAALLLRPAPESPGWLARALTPGRGAAARLRAERLLDLALPALLAGLLALEQASGASLWRHAALVLAGGEAQGERAALLLALGVALACALTARRPLRFAAPHVLGDPPDRLLRERSFFGVYSVMGGELPFGRFHWLLNGTTNHGMQNLASPLAPPMYYTREGPVGQFFSILKDTPGGRGRVGVIGLGVGAIACHAAPGQRLTFYEIDPLDERIARDERYFTYLSHCGEDVDVVIGDGRLTLAREPDGAFAALVVDAFSGDAIPAHLLTREALALYFAKLAPDGLLLMHVTNSYIDLLPVVAALVADAGLEARASLGAVPTQTPMGTPSDWIVVARRAALLARFGFQRPAWTALPPAGGGRPWTDDFTNILPHLRFELYGLGP